MKILYHHRTQGKSAEGVHVREMVKALRSLGNEVYVVSPPGVDVFNEEEKKKAVSGKAKIWSLISKYMPQIGFECMEIGYNLIAYKKIKSVLEKEKIGLIYERNAFFCWAGVYLAKKHNIPMILEVNEVSGIKRQRGQLLVSLAKNIEKKIFERADAIFTVSSFLKNEIIKRGINAEKIFVMPNAVNEEDFISNNGDGQKIREEFGLNGELVLTFLGNFSRWDRLDFLVENFNDISKKNPNLHLMIIGDGHGRETVENMINAMGLTNKISLAGRIALKKVPEYISATDICVIPHSNPFGSPIVLFEYMAMGKPVVAPRLGPLEDVIENEKNGILFTPEDKGSFKRAVEGLIEDEAKRRAVGSEARKTVLKRHLWRHNAEQILRAFYDLKKKD